MALRGPPMALFLLALLGTLGPGCAGVPAVPVPIGSRIVIELYDARSGNLLALANESNPELAHLYSMRREAANLKLAPDQLIGELLHTLNSAALDRFGRVAGPEDLSDQTSYLHVAVDGRQQLFVQPGSGAPQEERIAFTHVKLWVNEYFSKVSGLQHVRNRRGGDLFRDDP
jgi:hypothetical protein